MKTEIYKSAKKELITNGINFSKNYYELNDEEKYLIKEAGKKIGYKSNYKGNRSVTSYVGRFFLMLQRIK